MLTVALALGVSCVDESQTGRPETASEGAPAIGDRPNFLLITIDTLRADRLSCYGYRKHQTPNIDRLASEGALFERAFCDVTWTTPSMSSVMTGTYATLHGYKSTNIHRLDEQNLTLAEVLREHGYTTAAVIGSFPLDSIYGLDQGFGLYDDEFTASIIASETPVEHVPSQRFDSIEEQRRFGLIKSVNDSRRPDPEVTAVATEWLRRSASKPFFLWVHYFGPHNKPDTSDTNRFAKNRRHLREYDPDVVTNDKEIGKLLRAVDELGLAETTLVILHADHGESLREHGEIGHGKNLYDPTLQIPLIVRFPGRVPPGIRVQELARNVDIFPTVLDAAGVQVSHPLSGRSLLPLTLPKAPQESEDWTETYMETYMAAHAGFARQVDLPNGRKTRVGVVHRGIRTARWKFVQTEPAPFVGEESLAPLPAGTLDSLETEELYDLDADPKEQHNLITAHPEVAARLRARLAVHLERERPDRAAPRADLDDDARERLRSLGYVE